MIFINIELNMWFVWFVTCDLFLILTELKLYMSLCPTMDTQKSIVNKYIFIYLQYAKIKIFIVRRKTLHKLSKKCKHNDIGELSSL